MGRKMERKMKRKIERMGRNERACFLCTQINLEIEFLEVESKSHEASCSEALRKIVELENAISTTEDRLAKKEEEIKQNRGAYDERREERQRRG
jgi:hypothetical protein